jgi:hypothetical protein
MITDPLTVCSSSDPFPALDVAQVFARIKEHNRKACEGILHIVEAGKLLTLLKRKLPHGQFIKMATQETGLSRSTISRYMQIASNGAHVGHLKSGRDAIALITDLTTRKEQTAPRKASPVILDAEIVAPDPRSSATSPRTSPAPVVIEAEIVEPGAADNQAPNTTPVSAPNHDSIPKWIPDDAMDIWAVAKTHLDKILSIDKSREKVLMEVITYCREKISPGTSDAFLTILELIPELDQSELQRLYTAIKTRWMRGGKEDA